MKPFHTRECFSVQLRKTEVKVFERLLNFSLSKKVEKRLSASFTHFVMCILKKNFIPLVRPCRHPDVRSMVTKFKFKSGLC
jgi:hypothetical protein